MLTRGLRLRYRLEQQRASQSEAAERLHSVLYTALEKITAHKLLVQQQLAALHEQAGRTKQTVAMVRFRSLLLLLLLRTPRSYSVLVLELGARALRPARPGPARADSTLARLCVCVCAQNAWPH